MLGHLLRYGVLRAVHSACPEGCPPPPGAQGDGVLEGAVKGQGCALRRPRALRHRSAMGMVNGQSLFLRGTSLYIHLVDLVFVVLVFTVYNGKNSPRPKALTGPHAPTLGHDGRFATVVDEEGTVLRKQF